MKVNELVAALEPLIRKIVREEMQSIPRLALTKQEAAKALGVCERTIWKLAASGEIQKTAYGDRKSVV